MDDRLTTPPPGPARSAEQSTPLSKGSGSHSTSALHHTQEHYAPYLEEDLVNEAFITVDEFLHEILRVPAGWEDTRKIPDTAAFKKKMDKYTATDISKETALYHPFVELANDCLAQLRVEWKNLQFCRNDPVIVRGSKGARKPDVVNVKGPTVNLSGRLGVDEMAQDGPKGAAFHWRELLSFWEFKLAELTMKVVPDVGTAQPKVTKKKVLEEPVRKNPLRESTSKAASGSGSGQKRASEDSLNVAAPAPKRVKYSKEDPRLQCASYALELLSNGGLRSHVIAVLVSRNSLELLYYDRSIVVRSQPLRFTEHTTTFLAILFGFGQLSNSQWGYIGPEVLKGPDPATFFNDYKQMYADHVLTLNGWTLKLGDVIFRAHGIIGRGTVVVHAEVTSCVPHPKLKGEKVVVKWSWVPKSRTSEAVIVHAAVEQAKQSHPDMVHHLPNIYHSEEFADDIPEFLKRRSEYEERVLRIIVQEELQEIEALTDPDELAQAFKQIFECYRWLYEGPKIIHRDISVSNLMFQRINGQLYGVLNNFDLAVFHEREECSTSKQRTGTKPYMATDLLVANPPKHLYRHDLESFLYVLVFLTCDTRSSTLGKWEELGTDALKAAKADAISDMGFPPQKPSLLKFDAWTRNLQIMFATGMFARRIHALTVGRAPVEFDNKTLGNNVTFDTFAEALQAL